MAEEHARKGPLLLLDGMSLAFRAYFALPDTLATKSGVVTNAVHGFTSMLVYLIREQQPSALAVAFDAPGDTFRDEMLEDYKAGRAATPWLLPPQFDIIREVMDALAIPVIEAAGFEADDVIATLATQAAARDSEVVIVTGDRDSFQLVQDPYIRVLYNKRGVSDYALYDEAGIFERTGVQPDKYVLLASLRGDPSDNLPGIPGVGEKTAAKLLTNYGDLDGVFSHLGELTPKLRENLEANEHLARSNARVIPLVRDVPLDVDVSELQLGGWNAERAEATFEQYEMKTVWQRLAELIDAGALGERLAGSTPRSGSGSGGGAAGGQGSEAGDAAPAPAPLELRDLAVPTTAADAAKQLGELGKGRLAVAGRWNGMPGRSDLVALLVLATEGDEAGLGVFVPGELLGAAAVVKKLNALLAQHVLGHNVKELMRSLLPLGIDVTGLEMDTSVAAYLLDASTGEYKLEQLREQTGQLALEIIDAGETAADLAKEAAGEASDVLGMAYSFHTRITADDMRMLHDDIETPLVRVLARMEVAGIGVDRAELQKIADTLKESAATLQDEVQKIAGHEFNVNSTPQLRTVLYEELGLTPRKKTKTGYSTDAQTLESLRDEHPIIEMLLNYREVEKLRSTYGESLLAEVQADGRIHASFGQTVARTGRISSDRPNLHNIPVRSDLGKQFRRAFVPGEGCTFLVADYDQVELRCIAHLSEDPGLIEAMTSGADVHRTVAAAVYGIPPEEVTHTQREFCKMVSYGLAYGMEAYGLSQRLGVAVEEAAAIMESYFGAFPLVRQYMDATVADAKIRGATRTQFGRIRPLPDLQAANYRVRQAAERQAMNAGIQGLAADIFKLALVRLDRDLEQAKLQSRLVLQVHDEVIVEVAAGEEDDVHRRTESALTGAADLNVPLTVSMATGPSWAAAKG
ncbi:MAG TPA: DNA polymerase I [Acidimicrobiales bacterium]|jgi:DNA polymerase-1